MNINIKICIRININMIISIDIHMNIDIKIISDQARIRPEAGEVYRLKADNKKAKKLLNWKPEYSGKNGLKKGLKKTIEWFSDQENINKYKASLYNI